MIGSVAATARQPGFGAGLFSDRGRRARWSRWFRAVSPAELLGRSIARDPQLLFRLPRMPEPQRTEFRAGPIAAAANDALQEGDLDTAQRHVDQLTEQYPHLTATRSAQVAMLEARGEYARATLHLLDYLSSGPDLPPREMSYLLAGLAGLGFAAAETGQLPAETILPTAKKALTDAIQLGYPEFELSGTRGMLAWAARSAADQRSRRSVK